MPASAGMTARGKKAANKPIYRSALNISLRLLLYYVSIDEQLQVREGNMVGTVNIQQNAQGELQGLKFVNPTGGGDCAAFTLALFFADNILELEKQKEHSGIKRVVALFAEHMGFAPEQFSYEDLKAYILAYPQKESVELLLWQPMVKFLTECELGGKTTPAEQLEVYKNEFDTLHLLSILDDKNGLTKEIYEQLKANKTNPAAFQQIYEAFSKKHHTSANALLAVKAEEGQGYKIEDTIKMIIADSDNYENFIKRLKNLLVDGKDALCDGALKILQNYGFERNPAIVSQYLPIHVCNVTAESPDSPVKVKEHNTLKGDVPTLYFAHSEDFTKAATVTPGHWHLYASTQATELGATNAKAPPALFPLLAANRRSEYFTNPIHLPLPKSVKEKVSAGTLTYHEPEAPHIETPDADTEKTPKTNVKKDDKGAGHYKGMPTPVRLEDPKTQALLKTLKYQETADGRWVLDTGDGEISWGSDGLSTTSKALNEGTEMGKKVAERMVDDFIKVMMAQGITDPKQMKAHITSDSEAAKFLLAQAFKAKNISTNLDMHTQVKPEAVGTAAKAKSTPLADDTNTKTAGQDATAGAHAPKGDPTYKPTEDPNYKPRVEEIDEENSAPHPTNK